MDAAGRQPHTRSRTGTVGSDLHVCPSCGSELVYPLDWAPRGSAHWQVKLRCPECEWRGGGTFPQAPLDEFDRHLDLGTESVIEDLKALTHSNMEEEVASFARALEVDLILPEDF